MASVLVDGCEWVPLALEPREMPFNVPVDPALLQPMPEPELAWDRFTAAMDRLMSGSLGENGKVGRA